MTNQLNDVEEQISDPEVRIMEITQSYQQTKKKKKNGRRRRVKHLTRSME